MLKTRLIPCMLFNGMHLVKTIKFGEMRTLGNPVQAAKVYNARNVDALIFLDVTATVEGREPSYEIIEEVVRECFMPTIIGGGICSLDHVAHLLAVGADKVCINKEAIARPEFISEIAHTYGAQCVVAALDVKRQEGEHYIYTQRGTVNTGKKAAEWARECEYRGAGEIFLNSIDQDGTMAGYDLSLIQKVAAAVSIPVIACGGAGKVHDIIDAVKDGGANAIALASMFHYTGHTANSIKQRMHTAGIPVRLQSDLYFV